MRRIVFAIAVCLWPLTGLTQEATPGAGPVPERYIAVLRDTDLPGGDLTPQFDTTLAACQTACLSDPSCRAFTFNLRANACFPKSGVPEAEGFAGALSAVVFDTDPAVLAGVPQRRAALSFLRSRDLSEAREQAEGLALRYAAGTSTAQALADAARRAARGNDLAGAVRLTGAAVTRSDDPALWSAYARRLLELSRVQNQPRRQLEQRALWAATNAALRAPEGPVLADALDGLARALEAQGRGRDSIGALRLAVAQGPRDDLSAALDRARGLFGFRVTGTQVDSEAASPRICALFSEDLAEGGAVYEDYVQAEESGLAVEAEGRQLCVTGLRHGVRYTLTLRAGLPAASGEALAAPVTLSQYVRDRSPGVRFPGRAYILPRSTAASVPVIAVNTDTVALRLYSVSDRNTLRALQEEFFGRPLSEWDLPRFRTELAEEVWAGVGEVASELNADVTTRLPLGDVVRDLPPGLYALEARAADVAEQVTTPATQWFLISDLGLSAMSGSDGVHVVVRSLETAEAYTGATVRLIADSNRVLGEAVTDSDGYARFAPGLALGRDGAAPALVTVRDAAQEDYAFLSLRDAEFDLSDRGVAGREAAGPIDVFLTTDRGAYRAGETIHATVLARDGQARALAGLPLTAILTRADGVEFSRTVLREAGAGGFVAALPLGGNVPRGTWRLAVHADPKAPALAEARLLVEDFLPERIDVALDLPEAPLAARPAPSLGVQADYLFGAPAGDLPIEGEVVLRATQTLADWPGYRFGRHDAPPGPVFAGLPGGARTDASGAARLALDLPEPVSPAHPRVLTVTARVSDGGGRPVERQLSRALAPAGPLIGIRPLFEGTLPEGGEAQFDVIGVGAEAMPVRWVLNRVETRYQWFQSGGAWDWEPVTTRARIASGTGVLDGPLRIAEGLDWGAYELRVEREGAPYAMSSVGFSAGWSGNAEAGGAPDVLEVSLDAAAYEPGDTARLRIVPREGGTALVRVMSDRLIDMRIVELGDAPQEVLLPVTEEWGAGAYVSATLLRPLDDAGPRTPLRALGLAHARIDPGTRALGAVLEAPQEAAPRGPLDVALRVDGAVPGETVYASIAAVDLGILNLTGFDSPDPQAHYFGQRRLGVALRDVYGRLIDSRSGVEGAVRSGGDASAGLRLEAPPPTEALVAFHSGPLEVGADGLARARFDLPAFNGTVRLMAVAWSETGVGQAEADVLVRDPVVLRASLPRFLAPGDRTRLLLEIAHATGPVGEIGLTVSASAGLTLGDLPAAVTLGEGERVRLSVPLAATDTAGRTPGLEEVNVRMTLPGGDVLDTPLLLPLQVSDPEVAETSQIVLAPGERYTLSAAAFAGFRPGTGRATIAAGPLARFDVPGLLARLDTYPYGCTEQITSRALPLLYLSSVAEVVGQGAAGDLDQRIAAAIDDVLANQARTGGFGLWRPLTGDLWLDAYVTDFLSRARARGYDVPDIAFGAALDNLRNAVAIHPDFEAGGEALAYALMVLAREGAAAMGDLRYYADVKVEAFATPLARAQLGAALALYGDQPRADAMFRAGFEGLLAAQAEADWPLWRDDYGSAWRDTAGLLALAAEAGSDAIPLEALAGRLVAPGRPLSTQEAVWALLAAQALIDAGPVSELTLNGTRVAGPLVEALRAGDASGPREIVNTGAQDATLRLTRFGVPEGETVADGTGFRLTRSYLTLEGVPADPGSVAVGTRLVALLTVVPFGPIESRLMIDDPLPAGFEIDNPNLLRGGDLRALGDLGLIEFADHTEFRQDRFLAALDWRGDAPIRLGYVVRAVTPGAFHHPAARVEDMYRPQFRAQTASGRVVVSE
ncbi:MAG: alpha-2-macroglobulin family protein [Pseudomonadota bacterium]